MLPLLGSLDEKKSVCTTCRFFSQRLGSCASLSSDSFGVIFSIFLKVPTKFIFFSNKVLARSTLEYQLSTYIVRHSLNKSFANPVTTASPTEHIGSFDLLQLIIVLYVRFKSMFGQKREGSLLCSKRGRLGICTVCSPSHLSSSYPFSSLAILITSFLIE